MMIELSGLNIESATLEGIQWASEIFAQFLESQKQLKKLHLNSVSTRIFEGNHLDRINFDELEELFVEDIEFEEPKDLQNFCGFLKKLRSLRILKLYIKIDLALLKVVLNELPMLKSVDFGPARIQPIPELNYLSKNFEIEKFAVASFNAEVFPTIKTLLPLLPNLKNINVSECRIELLLDPLDNSNSLMHGYQIMSTRIRLGLRGLLTYLMLHLFLYITAVILFCSLLLMVGMYRLQWDIRQISDHIQKIFPLDRN
jgi:hypothetical protein